jgi:hypothetical protein
VVDHRHLTDKGDIIKMAKVWVYARDYLFILVSQSLRRGTQNCAHNLIKVKNMVFISRYSNSLQDTESTNGTRKGRINIWKNKAYS